jgi:hypothetical protein
MTRFVRALARKTLGVSRTPTYYLPWLTRPGLGCAVLINNIESRFRPGHNQGPFPSTVRQYDADGSLVREYAVALASSTDTVEVPLTPTAAGRGFVTVDVSRIHSDLYVTLSDGAFYAATHGRHEFIEAYPALTRWLMAALGGLLALVGGTIPAFRREQYAYLGGDSRSHLLIMNLSNVTNRIRVSVHGEGGGRLLTVPSMGSRLVDAATLGTPAAAGPSVRHLHLEGNAWFNLYLVGAGPRDLAGPVSLMHVK